MALGRWATIVPSVSRGPTPLRLVDPKDPRVLRIGLESLPLAWTGIVVRQGGAFAPPPIAVPNQPGFQDAALYLQAFTWPGPPALPTLVAKVSQPVAVRFGRAFMFRDRKVALATPRVYHQTVPLADGRVFVVAGSQAPMTFSPKPLASTEIYDPYVDRWTAGAALSARRMAHDATRLPDGRVLISGGMSSGLQSLKTCEIFDPKTNTVTPTGAMSVARVIHEVVPLRNGKMLAIGGFEKFLTNSALATVNSILQTTEIYDPAKGVWSAAAPMSVPRAGVAVLELSGGRILVAGGAGWTRFLGFKIPTIWRSTEIYDPATGRWSKGPDMNVARGLFEFTPIGKGRYLVAGGVSQLTLSNPGAPTPTCEIFDPATRKFTSTGRMSWPRALNHTVPLGGGRYLTMGGGLGQITAPSAIRTTEIYDEKSGSWTMGPNLTISRVWYQPFTLPTGQTCLVAGGTGSNSNPVVSTEWFYP